MLQNLLSNNQLIRNAVNLVQNDPLAMQALNNMIQNNPEPTTNAIRVVAQNFLNISGDPLNEDHVIDELQYKEMETNKKIEELEELCERYKKSRQKLIDKNDSLMKQLNLNPQNIEKIPSGATQHLAEVEVLNKKINEEQSRYDKAKCKEAKINCLKELINLKDQKINYLNQLSGIYKSTGKDLIEANKLLDKSINAGTNGQKTSMENFDQASINPTGSVDVSKSSLLEKMEKAVDMKNKSKNDIKTDTQQNYESLK